MEESKMKSVYFSGIWLSTEGNNDVSSLTEEGTDKKQVYTL